MTPTIAARLKAINLLASELTELFWLHEPIDAEDYERLLNDMERALELSGELTDELRNQTSILRSYQSDFLEDLQEKNTRDADLYGMPNHKLDGDPR